MRDLLTLSGLAPETFAAFVDRGQDIIAGRWQGYRPLADKIVGIYFKKPSTRTRTSFTSAAIRLGSTPMTFGPSDLQISTGETLEDTARVMAGYLDLLVVRTNEPLEEMRALAGPRELGVINAMSDCEHPTQAVGDFITLKEAFGDLDGLHLLYVGEGNNTAAALVLAAGKTPGFRLTLATPEGFGVDARFLDEARAAGAEWGTVIEQIHDPEALPRGVDAVYATRWQTMGVDHADADWKERFRPYTVTEELMERVSKPGDRTIFLHDLPAVRGEDVTDGVLDGPRSWAWRQAVHKMTSAMVVLAWCAEAAPPV